MTGMITRLARVLAALTAVPLLTLGALPAAATTHHHPPVAASAPAGMTLVPAGVTVEHGKRVTWYDICTNAEPSLCILSNGPGNAVTVVGAGYVKWQAILAGPNGDIEWQNGSGNCMKATTGAGLIVTVINGACDGGASKHWRIGGNGNLTFYSAYTGGFMGIDGHPTSGDFVRTGPGDSGFYYGWTDRIV